MKKKVGLVLLLAVLACSVCASTFGAAAQTPAPQSVSLKDMVAAVLAEGKNEADVYGKTVAGDVFDYALGYGEVDATAGTVAFSPYEVSTGAGVLKTTVEYTSGTSYGFWSNLNTLRFGKQWRDSGGTSQTNGKFQAIIRLTCKQNVALSVTHAAYEQPSTPLNAAIHFSVYRQSGSAIELLQDKVPAKEGAENSLGGCFQVKAGQTIYYEMKRTDGWGTSVNLAGLWPTFTADPAGYVPVTRTAKSLYDDILPGTVAADRGEAAFSDETTYHAGVAALSGNITLNTATPPTITALSDVTVASFRAFDKYANNALQTDAKNSISYASVYFGGNDPLVRTDPENNLHFGVKLTSVVDTVVSLEHPAFTPSGTAYYIACSVEHTVNGSKYAMPLADAQYTLTANTPVAANHCSPTIHIKANDTLYILLIGGNRGVNMKFAPTIVVDTAGFDETQAPDFSWSEALDRARSEAKTAVQAAYEALNGDDYTQANRQALAAAWEKVKAAIDAAATPTAVATLVETFRADIAAVLTTAQTTEAKAREQARLTAYIDGLPQEEFTADNWAEVQWLAAAGAAALDDATPQTAEELTAITDSYLQQLEAVGRLKLRLSLYDTILPETVAARGASVSVEETTYRAGYASLTGVRVNNAAIPAVTAVEQPTVSVWNAFETFSTSGAPTCQSSGKNAATTYSSVYFGGANRFIRTDPENDRYFALQVTSAVDTVVSLEHPAFTPTGSSYYLAFSAEHTAASGVRYAMAVADAQYLLSVNTPVEQNALRVEIHVKANDTLYMLLIGGNRGVHMKFAPTVVVNTAGFDAEKALDFSWGPALDEAKTAAGAQLQETYDAMQEADYTAANWAAIGVAVQAARAGFTEATSQAAVTALLQAAFEQLASILRIQDTPAAKAAQKARLSAYVALLSSDDYTADNWAHIERIAAEGAAAVEAADPLTEQTLSAVVDEFIAQMDAVALDGVKLRFQDAVKTVYDVKSGAAFDIAVSDTSTVNVLLGHGVYKDVQPFDKFENNALQTQLKGGTGYAAVYAGGRGLIRTDVTQNEYFIVRLTATVNTVVTLRNEAVARATNGGGKFRLIQATAVGQKTYYATVHEIDLTAGAFAKNALGGRVHLPAGDTLLLVVEGASFGTEIYVLPDFFLQTGAHYDADSAHDFTAAIALAEKKEAVAAQFATWTADIAEADYSQYQFALYTKLAADFADELDAAHSAAGAELALANFKDGFDRLLTLTQQGERRADGKAQLTAYRDALTEDDYSEEDLAKLDAIVADFSARIDAAETEYAIQAFVAAAKGELDRIPKTVWRDQKRGCGANAAAGCPFAVLLLGAAVVAFCRRKAGKTANNG